MRLGQRTFGTFGYSYISRQYPAGLMISSYGHTLYVENREFYTTYRLYNDGHIILQHDVRTPEPLPIRPAQIIHARHIPWFMWLYYAIRDWRRQRLSDRQWDKLMKKEQARREAVRQAVKERGLGHYGGRYNR